MMWLNMHIIVRSESIEYQGHPAHKGTFFEAIENTNMDPTIDLEAYFMFKLTTISYSECKMLLDKYCLPANSLCSLTTNLSVDPDVQSKNVQCLIDYQDYETVHKLLANDDWSNYIRYVNLLDPNVQDMHGDTAIMYACKNHMVDTALDLLQRCDPNIQDKHKITPLILACYNSLETVALELLATGQCNVNAQDENGQTALMVAYQRKLYKVASAILSDKTCDINLQDEYSNTALFYLCDSFRRLLDCDPNFIRQCITELISAGTCDFNHVNKSGYTVLHWACRTEFNYAVALELIAIGKCDPNICEWRSGMNALMSSCCCNGDIVTLALLATGQCDITARNKEGQTVMDLAKKYGKTRVIEQLQG